MPERIPDKTLGAHLEQIELKLDKVKSEQRVRNWALFALALILALGQWAIFQRQQDAADATQARIDASCHQQNRAFREYTMGLVNASGANPNDPQIKARLAQIPRRQCTPDGNTDYFNNAPTNLGDEDCVGDGKGFCVPPTTTTTVP